jgi:hypothetical protein
VHLPLLSPQLQLGRPHNERKIILVLTLQGKRCHPPAETVVIASHFSVLLACSAASPQLGEQLDRTEGSGSNYFGSADWQKFQYRKWWQKVLLSNAPDVKRVETHRPALGSSRRRTRHTLDRQTVSTGHRSLCASSGNESQSLIEALGHSTNSSRRSH